MYLFGFRPHLTAGGPEVVLLAFHKLRMKEVGTGKRGSLTLSYPKAFVMPFKGQKPNLCKNDNVKLVMDLQFYPGAAFFDLWGGYGALHRVFEGIFENQCVLVFST